MTEKIYIVGDAGVIFYGNEAQMDDCFMFMHSPFWSDDDVISHFSQSFPNDTVVIIEEGECITRERFDAMSIEEGNQAILNQIAEAKEK